MNNKFNELIFLAETLGSEPNTITEGPGERYYWDFEETIDLSGMEYEVQADFVWKKEVIGTQARRGEYVTTRDIYAEVPVSISKIRVIYADEGGYNAEETRPEIIKLISEIVMSLIQDDESYRRGIEKGDWV